MTIETREPVLSDSAYMAYCGVVSLAVDRIEEDLCYLEENPDTLDNGIMGNIAAMRVLGQAVVDSVGIGMSNEQAERFPDWERRYFQWFSHIEKKMPVKYREKMRASAEREFAELRELYG